MSVMIKGMEMPKYKGEHKNFDRYGCFLTVYKNGEVELHVFENDYTIEEIPTPHGRLIDADELLKAFKKACEQDGHWVNFFALVESAPTIIEAEA